MVFEGGLPPHKQFSDALCITKLRATVLGFRVTSLLILQERPLDMFQPLVAATHQWVLLLTVIAAVSGCQSQNDLVWKPPALSTDHERQLVAARNYLQAEGFTIDRFDLRSLSLTTQPQRIPAGVDTLRFSQARFSDVSEGFFAGTQRRVRIGLRESDWQVEAYFERPHYATRQLTHASNSRPTQLTAVPDELARAGFSSQDWQVTRRDPVLEARLIEVLASAP